MQSAPLFARHAAKMMIAANPNARTVALVATMRWRRSIPLGEMK